jgi:hypothetical protein
MLNLLNHEEAARIQKQLVERGYLLGPADGVWGPRTHAAHEDFRRVQGLGSDEGRIKETQIAVVEEPQPGTGSLATAETRGPVEEEAVLPPGPSTELTGLGNKPTNDLPPGEVRDAAPEPQLAVPLRQAGAEATYVGVWARSRADCFLKTYAPPLAISAQRAESFGGHMGSCEFAQVQQEGAGWRTRARCSAHGKSWTANVQLRVTGSTLSWSSERGQVTYYRCPRR